MLLGTKIKMYRRRRGISQEKLGQSIGKSKRQISSYESSMVIPTLDVLKKICIVFDVSVIDFLYETEYGENHDYSIMDKAFKNISKFKSKKEKEMFLMVIKDMKLFLDGTVSEDETNIISRIDIVQDLVSDLHSILKFEIEKSQKLQ